MKQRRYFGTDGVRGTANTEPMTAATTLRLGAAAGHLFTRGSHRHSVVIGKDTRLSGYMVEPALTAGFVSVGMDVLLVGPMPTPAVAMLTHSLRADLGVMISASHNSYEDNGIKIFGPDGYKLSDETELLIENVMDQFGNVQGRPEMLSSPDRLGRVRRLDDAVGRYIEAAKRTFPYGLRLDGLKVVVDCANGAAYRTAPAVLWELGAEVVSLGIHPDGKNINAGCGTQNPAALQEFVVSHGADIGIALDGDADRVILCDETGRLVDGDQILALIARRCQRHDKLAGETVVATVMSNLGLDSFFKNLDINLVRTAVGDRYVAGHMRQHGYSLGGEQSGHIILGDHSTTGDGLVAALQVLAELVEGQCKASELLHIFDPFPQVLKNIRVLSSASAEAVLESDIVASSVAQWERRFNESGRVVLRKSGTEPVIRLMVEGPSLDLVEEAVRELSSVIEHRAGVHCL